MARRNAGATEIIAGDLTLQDSEEDWSKKGQGEETGQTGKTTGEENPPLRRTASLIKETHESKSHQSQSRKETREESRPEGEEVAGLDPGAARIDLIVLDPRRSEG